MGMSTATLLLNCVDEKNTMITITKRRWILTIPHRVLFVFVIEKLEFKVWWGSKIYLFVQFVWVALVTFTFFNKVSGQIMADDQLLPIIGSSQSDPRAVISEEIDNLI